MDCLRLAVLIGKITGTFPLGARGNFTLGSLLTATICFVVSCSSIAYRFIQLFRTVSYTSKHILAFGPVIVATIQVFAVLVYLGKLARNRGLFLELLLHYEMSKKYACQCIYHKLQSAPIFLGAALLSMSMYSAVILINSRKLFAATNVFNCFQNFFIVLQYFYFLQSFHVYFPIRDNRNTFTNQLFILRTNDAVMRLFQWPLLIIYANSFGSTVWYMFNAIWLPLYKNRLSMVASLYYFPFLALKVMTMVLPCVAAHQLYNMVSVYP